MGSTITRGCNFIHANARPLERAICALWFDGATCKDVENAVAPFAVGRGFGRGLEPDCFADYPSVLDTCMAGDILHEACVHDGEHYERVGYFLASEFDREARVWQIRPAADEATPSAPWWRAASDAEIRERFNGCIFNPTAHAVTMPIADDEVKRLALEALRERIKATDDCTEMHDLQCLARFGKSHLATDGERDKIASWIGKAVETDPAKWGGYCLRPLAIIDSPNHFALDAVGKSAVEADLDLTIAEQGDDGGWHPAWQWDDKFPGEWQCAEQAWSGILTLANLRKLRAFDRDD